MNSSTLPIKGIIISGTRSGLFTSKAASIIAQASEKLRSELEERCKEKLIEEVKFFGDHYPEEFERTQTDQETEIEKAIWGAIKALELKCKQPLKGMLYEFWQKT